MSNPQPACGCAPAAAGEKLIFACSGAADVGAVSDHAARLLTQRGEGKMYCLVGIGGAVPGILQRTRNAAKTVAIDGCELDCALKCLQAAGLTPTAHFRVTDLGMAKGKSPANDQNVIIVAEKAATLLA